jgi:probable phosphoglycerate mutase
MAITCLVAMSTRLWLARHGATDWSDAGRLNGWTDVPLNERGRLQARSLAERLAGRQFAAVWSSDLMRAIETARLAVGEPVPDGRLRELGFGSLEGRRWEECPLGVRKALAAFDGFEAPEGESVSQLCRRVHDFVEGLPEGGHLVFTHGGVIRLLLREGGHEARVAPGGLVEVARPDGTLDRGSRGLPRIRPRCPGPEVAEGWPSV